ncbi:cercosporin toxin biosynthesis protein [Lophiotrema nucula]|uniref:Cercosporin toxin biosynthesis protein n=1 Tax=Lophiotrema nucula TaxID=690887 RepID=A0A6A5YQE0_9PLEO|nr:cercosporin toxin biosynthesis protein [Lophiotrema nucula]
MPTSNGTNGIAQKPEAPLIDLAKTILLNASVLTHYELGQQKDVNQSHGQLEAANVPHPPQEVIDATALLLKAASDISRTVLKPSNYLKSFAYTYHEITAIAVVLEFNIHTAVPVTGSISFKQLAEKVEILPGRLERVLRLLFLKGIFYEAEPNHVAHTDVSLYLAENHLLAAFMRHCTHEAFPAASRVVDAFRAHPQDEEPNETGFNVAFNTEDPLFSWLAARPDRFSNFNDAMEGISQGGGRSADQVVGGYPWADLGKATIVDVGGGNGHISIALAKAYPELSFVVQDFASPVEQGKAGLPKELQHRIRFEEHDMFAEQSVKGADAYYLRHILHDWPDKWAVKIISKLVPALKHGARILISDSVIPPPGQLSSLDEKLVRYLDIQMMVLHNARERTEEDFAEILRQADARLKLIKVWKKGESVAASTLIEAQFLEQ